MNSVQKNFRKQMEAAKRQGKLPESFEAKRKGNIFKEHKAGFSFAGVGLIGILVFCWNVYALGTWVNAFFHGSLNLGASSLNLSNNQKAIHEYLSKNELVQTDIKNSLQMISDIYSKKKSYSVDAIKAEHETLISHEYVIETSDKQLLSIKNVYIQEFNVAENALLFAESNYGKNLSQSDINYINGIYTQIQQINIAKTTAYIDLFKSANIKYTVLPNGSINYQYTQ